MSKVLNNHPSVPEVTRKKIMALVEQYRYRPSAAARAIRENQTRQIGIMLSNAPNRPLDNPPAFEMVLGINNRLATEGYVLMLVRIGDVEQALHKDSRVFQENMLDGMIISGAIPDSVLKHVKELMPQCIFVDNNLYQPACCMQRDEFAAGRMVAQALVQSGYRRIVWLGPSPDAESHYSVPQRFAGVKAVADQAGIQVEMLSQYVPETEDSATLPAFRAQVRQACRSELGVAAYDKFTALQWASTAMEFGVTAPRDYGLACCDLAHDLTHSWATLSGAIYNRFEMGVQAAEMMLRRLHNPELGCASRKIPTRWHPGQTIKVGGASADDSKTPPVSSPNPIANGF